MVERYHRIKPAGYPQHPRQVQHRDRSTGSRHFQGTVIDAINLGFFYYFQIQRRQQYQHRQMPEPVSNVQIDRVTVAHHLGDVGQNSHLLSFSAGIGN